MEATYTKLKDDSWGIRVTHTPAEFYSVISGMEITVRKKSGEVKQETIKEIIWRGNGIALCTIRRNEQERRRRTREQEAEDYADRFGEGAAFRDGYL